MAESEMLTTILRLSVALIAGGLVGLERSYHGRPAGFREHTLVCISSCMLMLLADFHVGHVTALGHHEPFLDPTRMAQGIMTGIGFLGAGAIVKEGMAIRGLTTAASIWMISAIGIMIGMGYYLAAGAATFATFNINYVFRLIEGRIRSEFYAHLDIRFRREMLVSEAELRSVLDKHDCTATGMSYALSDDGRFFQYQMTVKTFDKENLHRLVENLMARADVSAFNLAPKGD